MTKLKMLRNISCCCSNHPLESEFNTKCNCCKCKTKVKGKFGLAWVTETEEGKTAPVGWQVEFIDTPSRVFQKCQDLTEWIKSPPIAYCSCSCNCHLNCGCNGEKTTKSDSADKCSSALSLSESKKKTSPDSSRERIVERAKPSRKRINRKRAN
ncbi:hypothetical protein RI129_007529 [Pyrocoelia pectoralis]|uniref:Uncharacterized protein n=1 Tax=Pyrocoelia pectoralis TaxID=417401 RepID=A0AAN7VHY2_9COLE